MTDTSTNLNLPFIQPAQAQKHVTHNEAIEVLDHVTQLVLVAVDALNPPAVVEDGAVYALGAAPTGDWSGRGGKLACRSGNGWLFVTPKPGWQGWLAEGERQVVFDGTAWADTGAPGTLGVNTSADEQNRLPVSAPSTLLTHEGAGHQLKINKSEEADTASLLFQTGWSARAEMGTTGSDDFAIKVSDDGANWNMGLSVDAATGWSKLARMSSGSVAVADDQVGVVQTPGAAGFVFVTAVDSLNPSASHSAIFVYDTGTSPELVTMSVASGIANAGSSALQGQSGANGMTNVAVQSGAILIENRSGQSQTYSLTFIGGHD